MEKNYYDILEINRNASPQIIEKAYKTLVKMYHPDLQEDGLKQEYENKLKEINEAYEVLSNPVKKDAYDAKLEEIEQAKNLEKEQPYTSQDNWFYEDSDDYNTQQNNANPQNIQNNYSQKQEIYENHLKQEAIEKARMEAQRQAEYEDAINRAYHDAYIQDLKNRGYKIRYKKSLKDYLRSFVTIIIVVIVLVLLWQIPFVHNFFIKLYEENDIINSTVNIFLKLFNRS